MMIRRLLASLRSFLTRGVPGAMTCAELEAFIVDYLDGTLSRRRRSQFVIHLMLCPKCRAYLDSYKKAVALGQRVFINKGGPAAQQAPEELIQAILASRRQ